MPRPKGIPNKLSRDVRENIVEVFIRLGGVDQMTEWALENETQFYQIYAKLLPKDMTLDLTDETKDMLAHVMEWAAERPRFEPRRDDKSSIN